MQLPNNVWIALPIGDCDQLMRTLNIILSVAIILETGLCYLRIFTVYRGLPYVVAWFGLTWLSVVSMAPTLFKTFGAVQIEPTQYCRETVQGVFAVPTILVLFINDTLIYVAIAYRIYNVFVTYEFEADLRRKCVIFLFGASLPIGSKIVLLESQLYCL